MSHIKLVLPQHANYQEFLDAMDTSKGITILELMEVNFPNVTALDEHTARSHKGALVHLNEPGDTILFEHLPRVDFVGFAYDLAVQLGLNAS
jgi:hypothetical protein